MAEFFSTRRRAPIPLSPANRSISLVLTHGHFDHVVDGAAVIKRHGCKTAFHPDTAPMVNDREFFRQWGFEFEIEPFDSRLPARRRRTYRTARSAPCAFTTFRDTVLAACAFIFSMRTLSSAETCFSAEALAAGIFPEGIETCSSKAFGRSCFPSRTQSPCFPGTGRQPRSDGSGGKSFSRRIEGIFARQRKPSDFKRFFLHYSSP